MLRKITTLAIALTVLGLSIGPVLSKASSQTSSKGQIIFILDASSSMLARDGDSVSRIDEAKTALGTALNSVPADVEVGLRVYGHRVPDTNKTDGCQDTQLINAPAANNAAAIKASLAGVQAKGWTLIGKSLQDVEKDFSGEKSKTVILLSDGVDTCAPPDPCQVAKDLAARNLKIKVNTLGLVVNNAARTQLNCIATATGGDYYDINSVDRLQSTLSAIASREANLFSVQGIPIDGNPRIEQAPLLLPKTNYIDDIAPGEELYYAFEVLPEQEISFTVKAEDNNNFFESGDQLLTDWYEVETVKQINIGRNISQFTNFSGTGVQSIVLEDKAPTDLSEPALFAVKVKLNAKASNPHRLPLEIRLTTKGGTAPDNASADENKTAQGNEKSDKGLSALAIVGIVAGALALLALTAFVAYKLARKPRTPSSTDSSPPVNPTPPSEPPAPTQSDSQDKL